LIFDAGGSRIRKGRAGSDAPSKSRNTGECLSWIQKLTEQKLLIFDSHRFCDPEKFSLHFFAAGLAESAALIYNHPFS
jgi:hypothetical protein